MHELGLDAVVSGVEAALSSKDVARAEQLLWPALDQFPDLPAFWFYAGNIFMQTGRTAPAALCFERCVDLEDNPMVLANLGAAYRRLNDNERGVTVLSRCLARLPDNSSALVNLGAMFVNEGDPHSGIPYLERAKALGQDRGAEWNLGLLYLEAGRFGEGFDLYATGIGQERAVRFYARPADGQPGPDEPPLLVPDSPKAGKTLIVWGEQGIGDELMYGTVIEDARRDFGEVIFDCHPRLEGLHRRAHPGMRIYPTRKDDTIVWPLQDAICADYKAPLGELARHYRRTRDAFRDAWQRQGAIYNPDDAEAAENRARLTRIAKGRPIVGLATRGGVMMTSRTYRTLTQADVEPLFRDTDALFVSLDYEDMTGFAAWVAERYGADRYVYPQAILSAWDYHHTAALVAATDMVVTVCQSVAHLAAGMGHPVRVLTPRQCAWRYGLTEERWYWYDGDHAKLYRQDGQGWNGAVRRAVADIREIRA